MAIRREQVILDLEDNLTPGLARAAVAAGMLDRELHSLGGTSTRTGRDLDKPALGADKVGDSSRKAGPEIDRLSGRLRVLADVAITLGPALVPLGAATIPVLTASLAGLGAAAGGIGVTVLALHGIGDGIKAIQAYHLEPTAENFAKMREEMEKLGPSGAHFAHFIDDLGPALHDLQTTARDGLFPGLEDGINDLLTRLPQVKQIIADLSDGMGDLAREAGEGLAGPKFTAFFDYLETDARPTLEAFARSAGNVAEGIANLFVAFAPLNRDFTGGLESATKAFAKWSEGLDDNRSFQEFLAYIRESGPQAVEFLGAMVDALAGLVKAAAPMGRAVLPALTAVARVFAAISNSSVGPALYTAVAAFVAFRRAAALTNSAVAGVSGSIKRLGSETQTTSQKIGLLGARGGVVLAGAAAVGVLADNIDRIDTQKLDRNLAALGFGEVTDDINLVSKSLEELTATRNKVDLGGVLHTATLGVFGDSSMQRFADNVDQVDESLANLVETGQQAQAADLFQKISDLAEARGVSPEETAKQFNDYALALRNVADAAGAAGSEDALKDALSGTPEKLGQAGSAADYFAAGLSGASDAADDAADSTRTLNDQLNHLGNQLQRRADARDFQAAIDDFTKSMKDNGHTLDINTEKGRANQAALDGIASAARQMVQDLHGSDRVKALTQARRDFVDAATKILGSRDAAQKLANQLGILNTTRANPKVELDGALDAIGKAKTLKQVMDSLHSKDIYLALHYQTIGNKPHAPIPGTGQSAEGGTVPKTGMPYADRWHYMLADGEEVISNRHGQADRHRSLLKAINAGRLAGGGTAGSHGGSFTLDVNASQGGPGLQIFTDGVYSAAKALKALKAELDDRKKAVDKLRSARDQAVSNRDSLSSSIQDSLMGDSIFGDIPAVGGVWGAGSTPGGPATPQSAIAALNARKERAQRFVAAVNALKSKGVTGAALQAILGEGLEAAEAMAAADVGTLSTFATALNESNQALAAAGLAGGNAVFGGDVKATQQALNAAVRELHEIKQAIKHAEQANDKAQEKNAKDVKDGVNGAASNGHRRGR